MFDKVLVGVDGRPGGYDALALAMMLAGRRAELVVAEIVTPKRGRRPAPDGAALDEAEVRTAAAAAGIGHFSVGSRAIGAASVADGLVRLAVEEQADLVVVGSCRRGSLGRLVVGNDAAALLHATTVPVAVAPVGYRRADKHVAHIGVGLDASAESEHALALARRLRDRFAADLEVVEVLPPPNGEEGPSPATLLAHSGVDAVTIERGADPAWVLRRLADRCELVLIGTHVRNPTGRLLPGTTSDALSHDVPCVLIAVPLVSSIVGVPAA